MARITITNIDEELKQQFLEACNEDGVKMTDVLRALIMWYLKEKNRRKK